MVDSRHVMTAGHCVAKATGDSSDGTTTTDSLVHYFSLVLGSTSIASGLLDDTALMVEIESITVSTYLRGLAYSQATHNYAVFI